MKVFVTGATGALGRRVIRNLTSQNYTVVALSRSAVNDELLKKEQIEIRRADLFNKNDLIAATRGCDAILHLATSIPRKTVSRLRDWEMNDKIRIDGTANLISAAIANEVKAFICESVTTVYGQQNGHFVSTATVLPGRQVEMARSAIEMEQMIAARLVGKYIILRFGNFYSEDDFFTNNLIRNVSRGRMPMLGKGDFYMNWIHLEDAAGAIVFGLNNLDKLKGNILNVTDRHPVLYAEMLNYISRLTGHKRPFYLPGWIARLIIGKNNFAFLTNSYRVEADPLLEGWHTKYNDFITGITEIIKRQPGTAFIQNQYT